MPNCRAALDPCPSATPRLTPAQKRKLARLLVRKFRYTTEPSLKAFVQTSWSILEPATTLQWNWHLDLLCDWLTAVKEGKCRRLIINVPPRSMKSLLCTVFYPVWRWCTQPERRFMFVSYSDELSTDHSVFRRNVLNSRTYRAAWENRVKFSKDQNQKTQYENTRRGVMFATSITGSATGKGCDELIVDDPMNAKKAFSDQEREATNRNFDATFRSRLNDPATGTIILIMQRLHDMDLTGHVLAQEPGTWVHIKLPAEAELDESWAFPMKEKTHLRKAGELLWPQRFSHDVLAQMKMGMGSWSFSGQYQQNPAPREGAIIQRDWLRFYKDLPAEKGTWIQSWDCSFKETREADYVVGQVWMKSDAYSYLVDQIRERMDFVRTRQAIRRMTEKYPQATAKLVEDRANGPAIIASLKSEISGIIPVEPSDSKIGRLNSVSPLFEAGNVLLPERASWVGDFVEELTRFPGAAHDDQVDACSQALEYLNRKLGAVYEYYRELAQKRESG